MGSWEWFEFSGLSAEQTTELAAQVIPTHKEIKLTRYPPDDEDEPGEHVVLTV